MKLNKTLIIAALAAGGMFAAQVAVHAQDSTNTPPAAPPTAPPPPMRPGGPGSRGPMFDRFATQLALTDDQKAKAKPIFEERQQKLLELRRDTATAPTDKQAKYKAINDAAIAKFKEIPLSDEQMAKLTKMLQRPGRPPGGPGAPPPAAPGATPPASDAKPPQ